VTATLGEILARQAARPALRDRPFIFADGDAVTYGELDRLATRVAGRIAGAGVAPGDVVCALLPNSPGFMVDMFGAYRAGARFCPLNPRLTPAEIRFQLADSGARAVLTDAEHAPLFARLAAELPSLAHVLVLAGLEDLAGLPDPSGMGPSVVDDPDAVALVMYTSGTTGSPKGVMLSHRNVVLNASQVMERTEVTERDRVLHIMPLFHTNGIVNTTVGPLLAGASIALRPRFDLSDFWPAVARFRPTYFTGVPTVYSRLLAAPDPGLDRSSLRFVRCGSAPMPVDLQERVEAWLGVPVVISYGLAEGTCTSTMNPVSGRRKAGSVGVPLAGQEVEIHDEEGRELPAGTVGEVCIRGGTVMQGYLNRPEETAAALRDGWLRSGDLGYVDADGYLFLTDRKKDIIIRGGENISAREVEDVLYRHPAVLEAAVVGAADPEFGEQPVACVVLRQGATTAPDELIGFCRERLARFKAPRRVLLLDDLPKNAVGKIAKAALRAQVAGRRAS
jgi:acyl-CoA synthetase (AMP-forming)/AMP-acid ligase II